MTTMIGDDDYPEDDHPWPNDVADVAAALGKLDLFDDKAATENTPVTDADWRKWYKLDPYWRNRINW